MPMTLPHVEVRALFDSAKVRGGKYGWQWNYKQKAMAEQLLTMAILKWGA